MSDRRATERPLSGSAVRWWRAGEGHGARAATARPRPGGEPRSPRERRAEDVGPARRGIDDSRPEGRRTVHALTRHREAVPRPFTALRPAVDAGRQQIRVQVLAANTAGTLPPETRLATVRQLAGDLDVAPNTVARAYRELEADGVIETRGRKGTFVRSPAQPDATTARSRKLSATAETFVAEARRLGVPTADIASAVANAWRPEDDRGPQDSARPLATGHRAAITVWCARLNRAGSPMATAQAV